MARARGELWAAADRTAEPAKSVRRARSPARADRRGSSVRNLRAATVEDTSTPLTYQAKARRVADVFGVTAPYHTVLLRSGRLNWQPSPA